MANLFNKFQEKLHGDKDEEEEHQQQQQGGGQQQQYRQNQPSSTRSKHQYQTSQSGQGQPSSWGMNEAGDDEFNDTSLGGGSGGGGGGMRGAGGLGGRQRATHQGAGGFNTTTGQEYDFSSGQSQGLGQQEYGAGGDNAFRDDSNLGRGAGGGLMGEEEEEDEEQDDDFLSSGQRQKPSGGRYRSGQDTSYTSSMGGNRMSGNRGDNW
ncbi:Gre1p NDAI_0F01440 [Naumovozyma dairenensis CBS 421]|uniref:Uncharacterized protein n=1 Tax=Naumovozyma dairenensis (strain ATCC 10597 / BCRC 20456 / CBS 421 / NBRC 0211 / NRRL Y-12639) TaxID=1071378 RepID=G0WCF2_NAUDC|nr:hypothetical protein NDAI_0F01440 [Naumovozyma dairenensis CBS 421]CCD25463.1 hypothetical protein NDAI_0F01440 [Naumovozyma dairenensis CBS 421]